MRSDEQSEMFSGGALDPEMAQKALDELFAEAGAYRSSADYLELLNFTKRFPRIAPFNCLLLHVQKPGVQYVATVKEWKARFGRTIKPGARPLVILVPFGPVEFVYDVGDTEGPDLPDELLNPFKTNGELPNGVWNKLLGNLWRDGVRYSEADHGCNSAGNISPSKTTSTKQHADTMWKVLYELVVNQSLESGAKYATTVHELGHLYCGHLGTPDETWWPDRHKKALDEREFEAESVTWLVCERAGIKNPSAEYLSGYLKANSEVPAISLDAVLKAAGYIEAMGRRLLKARKKRSGERASRGVRAE